MKGKIETSKRKKEWNWKMVYTLVTKLKISQIIIGILDTISANSKLDICSVSLNDSVNTI